MSWKTLKKDAEAIQAGDRALRRSLELSAARDPGLTAALWHAAEVEGHAPSTWLLETLIHRPCPIPLVLESLSLFGNAVALATLCIAARAIAGNAVRVGHLCALDRALLAALCRLAARPLAQAQAALTDLLSAEPSHPALLGALAPHSAAAWTRLSADALRAGGDSLAQIALMAQGGDARAQALSAVQLQGALAAVSEGHPHPPEPPLRILGGLLGGGLPEALRALESLERRHPGCAQAALAYALPHCYDVQTLRALHPLDPDAVARRCIERARAQDSDVCTYLMTLAERGIGKEVKWALGHRGGWCDEDREDALQEVRVQLFSKVMETEQDIQRWQAYARGVAHNTALKVVHRRERDRKRDRCCRDSEVTTPTQTIPSPEARVSKARARARLKMQLAQGEDRLTPDLSQQCVQLLRLMLLEGESAEEAARSLEVRPSHFRVLWSTVTGHIAEHRMGELVDQRPAHFEALVSRMQEGGYRQDARIFCALKEHGWQIKGCKEALGHKKTLIERVRRERLYEAVEGIFAQHLRRLSPAEITALRGPLTDALDQELRQWEDDAWSPTYRRLVVSGTTSEIGRRGRLLKELLWHFYGFLSTDP